MRCDAVTRAAGAGLVMRACLILLAMGFVEQTAAATARQFLVQSYTCFDEQLAEIETGTVDSDEGIPSAEDFGRELSALSARLKDRQPMAFPAVVACQALGRLFPPLQRHWSAHRQDFALVLSPDLEPHRQVLSSLTERAMRHLRSQFDTQWPLAVSVVVSNDFASIRRFLTSQVSSACSISRFYMEAGLSHDWQSTFAAVFDGTPDEVFGCVE